MLSIVKSISGLVVVFLVEAFNGKYFLLKKRALTELNADQMSTRIPLITSTFMGYWDARRTICTNERISFARLPEKKPHSLLILSQTSSKKCFVVGQRM